MKILCVGDVVSREGCDYLAEKLPRVKRETGADVVIVNGENSAVYNGIDRTAYEAIMNAGADVVTGGNHSFQKKSANTLHDEAKRLIRPENVHGFDSGKSSVILDLLRCRVRVVNISGSLFMSECDNPFECIERLLGEDTDCITVVDFHAEATSEKQAMMYFLDGQVSLLYGTHTHVPTADEQITALGTGYISDIGMTGVVNGVLGKETECAVHNFRYPDDRVKIKDGTGECMLCGIVAEIDEKSKKCVKIERIRY